MTETAFYFLSLCRSVRERHWTRSHQTAPLTHTHDFAASVPAPRAVGTPRELFLGPQELSTVVNPRGKYSLGPDNILGDTNRARPKIFENRSVGPNCETWPNTLAGNHDWSSKVGPQFGPTCTVLVQVSSLRAAVLVLHAADDTEVPADQHTGPPFQCSKFGYDFHRGA